MEQSTTILDGYNNIEKGAYLGAIASIATADRVATDEEKDYLSALCESANLSGEQTELIMQVSSTEITDDDLSRFLDVLKKSELRFSLVSDLIGFARADQNYTEDEKKTVEKISQYLGVDTQQFEVLDKFTRKAVAEAPGQSQPDQQEQTTAQGFFDSLGFGDKLKNAGINSSSLVKGALGILGPIMLSKMMGGRRRSGGSLLGGLGGLLTGGGLLGNLLNSGGGFRNAGGLLNRILGRRN